MDSDCPSRLACFNGFCLNPCSEIKPCGINAECSVVDTLPLRTMSCLCLPGYVGDADIECKLGICPWFFILLIFVQKQSNFFIFEFQVTSSYLPISYLSIQQQHSFYFNIVLIYLFAFTYCF